MNIARLIPMTNVNFRLAYKYYKVESGPTCFLIWHKGIPRLGLRSNV